MNGSVVLGWGLAVAAVAVGYVNYGWPGVALAVSAIVFWLLLQFTRALRAMRLAGQSPVGQVPSVVMVHARLRRGMRLLDIIQLTRSLGEKVADDPETWRWSDNTGSTLTVRLRGARCTDWTLLRPEPAPEASPPAQGASTTPAASDASPGAQE